MRKSLKDSFFESYFLMRSPGAGSWYANGAKITLVVLRPIALFSVNKFLTTSDKESDSFDYVHVICPVIKFLTSSKDRKTFLIVFSHELDDRQRECTTNKNFLLVFMRVFLIDSLVSLKIKIKPPLD